MTPKSFKLRYNGIRFRVDCLMPDGRTRSLVNDRFIGRDWYEAQSTDTRRCTPWEFKKPDHARQVIREAYGYNAEIEDPEYR